jgi:ADP-heptose:LPS heptosyltransferase
MPNGLTSRRRTRDGRRREPRVLFVRLSALGDVVHVLPSVAALRQAHPRAFIGFAVEERAASLVRGHPQLDRVHVIPRATAAPDRLGAFVAAASSMARELRRTEYDVALDFQSNLRSSVTAWLSGAPRVIGQPRPYAKELSWVLERERPPPVPREVHKIERNLALLSLIGVKPAKPPRPVIPEPESSRALADAFARASHRRPVVLIHPGVSSFGAIKGWREEGFAAVARTLAQRGARVAVAFGGAGERAIATRIVERAAHAHVELAPDTRSVLDLAALERRADLFLGVDSGPLHLAAAVGTACVALYGPKDPRTYGPYWVNALPIRKGVACSPCSFRTCPRNECMTTITADEVLEAADAMIMTAAANASR